MIEEGSETKNETTHTPAEGGSDYSDDSGAKASADGEDYAGKDGLKDVLKESLKMYD